MLFNPRTENNTYSMLGPAVGVFLARSVLVDRRILRTALLALVAIGVLGTYEIGRLITSPAQSMWLAPLMCIVFAGYVAADLAM